MKEYITRSFHDYAKGLAGDKIQNAGAAYQLAVCYAIGFGVPFEPMESIKWLEIAAMGESQPAREALPRVIEVFDDDLHDYISPPVEESLVISASRSQHQAMPGSPPLRLIPTWMCWRLNFVAENSLPMVDYLMERFCC